MSGKDLLIVANRSQLPQEILDIRNERKRYPERDLEAESPAYRHCCDRGCGEKDLCAHSIDIMVRNDVEPYMARQTEERRQIRSRGYGPGDRSECDVREQAHWSITLRTGG